MASEERRRAEELKKMVEVGPRDGCWLDFRILCVSVKCVCQTIGMWSPISVSMQNYECLNEIMFELYLSDLCVLKGNQSCVGRKLTPSSARP